MVRKLLIIAAVVVALSLGSLFLPARQMDIEGIGRLSFETKITLSVGSEVAYASPDVKTLRPNGDADVSGTWTLTPAGGSRYEKIDEVTADDTDFITQTTAAGGYSYHTFAAFSIPSGSVVDNVTVYYRHRKATLPITYVGSASSTANNPTSGSFSLPSGWASGDTAVFWWYTYANTKTFTAPSGVTQKQQASSSGYGRLYIGYRVLQSGDSTFSWTASSVGSSTTIWGTSVFRNVDTTGDPFEAQSGAPATFTNARDPNPPSVTTLSNNAWVIPIFGKNNDYTSITPPANYTSAGSNTSTVGSDASAGVAYRQIATPGAEDPGVWTLVGGAASDDGYVWTGALRPDTVATANTRAAIKVGGNLYGAIDAGADPTTSWANRSYAFAINPKTNVAWTVDDINGVGDNALQAFGVNSTDSSPNISVSQCYAVVNYTPPAPPPPCWLSGWAKRVRLTIDTGDIGSSLSTFPVLLYLSAQSGRGPDDVTFVFNELGSYDNRLKIAVTTGDCTECFVEIEKWDQTNKQAWLWVRVPDISHTTELHLYYDSTHANNTTYVGDTNSTPAETVWDGNFKMVQHLGENATVVHDSTANNNDETNPPPAPPSPGYIRATYNDPGRINGCYSFSNDGTNGSRLQMAHSSSLNITEAITLEAFVYLNDKTNAKFIVKDDPFDIGGPGCYNLQQEALSGVPNLQLQLDLGGWVRASYPTYNTGEWLYVVGTYDRQTMRLYLNGAEVATSPQTAAIRSSSTVNVALGNRADDILIDYDLNGLLDEARISNTARSPEWIKASYESGRDDLFDFGPEETHILDIENIPGECNFGTVDTNSSYDSGLTYFTVTNNSGGAINISIKGTDMSDTEGGTPWTLSDDGIPGLTSYGLWAGLEGGGYTIIVKQNGPFNNLVTNLGDDDAQGWGLQLYTPTSFRDGYRKSGTVTLTAIFS